MIYLDNAATSWPKPPEVLDSIKEAMDLAGGNPGRSGHRLSIEAARRIYSCRERLAEFFNLTDVLRVIFTPNATYAINLVLKGLLKPGDSVVTSGMEHNAVMRPLRFLEGQGIRIKTAAGGADGTAGEDEIEDQFDSTTRLLVCTHASNVTGIVQPVEKLTALAHRRGVKVLVDAAQSAGILPIDIRRSGIDFLAFSGHKELLGPTGCGGLLIHPDIDGSQITPLVQGGTGSRSDLEYQPEDWPDKFEAGTANLIGIAGLEAGLKYIQARGIEELREQSIKLRKQLLEGLSVIPGVKIYGPSDPEAAVAIVSFTIKNKNVSDTGLFLDEEFGILTRVGLHCAPVAHRAMGTFPEGTVRLSPGLFTTEDEIRKTLLAVRKAARS
ncbi:MAG TPA: aminotransferase class V-fold PLP-dependent enzyme [Dehalococcoidales bacterium]|nr:aminotransferase class V-fold PLP-dependent enzyme [Dehalococcoidales bacterium]